MQAGVQRFFEHLPRLLDVPAGMELPVYSRREFSKSVWDMEVRGTRGVVNLVLNFPDQESSLAGLVAIGSSEAQPCPCSCSRAITDTADHFCLDLWLGHAWCKLCQVCASKRAIRTLSYAFGDVDHKPIRNFVPCQSRFTGRTRLLWVCAEPKIGKSPVQGSCLNCTNGQAD